MIARLSLRARLLAITVALLVTGLAVISSVVVKQLETHLMARMDERLSPLSSALATLTPEVLTTLQERMRAIPVPLRGDEFDLAGEGYVAFLAADGTVLREVDLGGHVELPRLDTAAVTERAGRPFTVDDASGGRWRVLAVASRVGEICRPC